MANAQVAELIVDFAPDAFNLSASCAFEYKNIDQDDFVEVVGDSEEVINEIESEVK